MPRLDLQGRHRTLLFMGGHGTYLVLVSLFPLVLPYAIPRGGDLSRLLILVNIIVLLMDVGNLGLGRGLQQLAIETPSAELPARLGRPLAGARLFLGLVTLALAGVVPLLFAWHPGWFDGSPWAAALVWLNAVLGLLRLSTQSLLYGTRRFGWFIGLDVAWAAARLLLVPLAWLAGGLYATLVVMALLWLGTLWPAVLVLRRQGLAAAGSGRDGLRALGYYLHFGFWLQAAYLAGSVARPLTVLAIATAVGHTAAAPHPAPGYAHLAVSLFIIGSLLMEATLMALYPEKARAGKEGLHAALERRAAEESRALLWLLGPLALVGWQLAPLLARVWPPQYHDLGPWVGVMALALPARAVAAPLLLALQARHRPRSSAAWQLARLAIVLAGLGLGLTVWHGGTNAAAPHAPLWGLVGGEWAATLLLVWRRGRDLHRVEPAASPAAAPTPPPTAPLAAPHSAMPPATPVSVAASMALAVALMAWWWVQSRCLATPGRFWPVFGGLLVVWLAVPALLGWVRPRVLHGMLMPAGRAARLGSESPPPTN